MRKQAPGGIIPARYLCSGHDYSSSKIVSFISEKSRRSATVIFSPTARRCRVLRVGQYIHLVLFKPFPPTYLDFCLFKSIAHIITAAQNTRIKYHRFSRQKPLSNINRYPQEAGKIRPMASRKSGSKSIGNIIPESIIEGKNTSCAIIVSFA